MKLMLLPLFWVISFSTMCLSILGSRCTNVNEIVPSLSKDSVKNNLDEVKIDILKKEVDKLKSYSHAEFSLRVTNGDKDNKEQMPQTQQTSQSVLVQSTQGAQPPQGVQVVFPILPNNVYDGMLEHIGYVATIWDAYVKSVTTYLKYNNVDNDILLNLCNRVFESRKVLRDDPVSVLVNVIYQRSAPSIRDAIRRSAYNEFLKEVKDSYDSLCVGLVSIILNHPELAFMVNYIINNAFTPEIVFKSIFVGTVDMDKPDKS